jgi:hypothetical protein
MTPPEYLNNHTVYVNNSDAMGVFNDISGKPTSVNLKVFEDGNLMGSVPCNQNSTAELFEFRPGAQIVIRVYFIEAEDRLHYEKVAYNSTIVPGTPLDDFVDGGYAYQVSPPLGFFSAVL